MKEFNVIVKQKAIWIEYATEPLKRYDFKAIVDGEIYHYRIIRDGKLGGRLAKEAFGRASVEIHYHAKNQGNIVRFEKVSRVSKKRKREISKKQLSLFGGDKK